MKIQYAALTDVGKKREHNEDNHYFHGEFMIFCVADGMGGAAAGEVASEIVVNTVERDLPPALKICAEKGEPDSSFERYLARAIETANSTIQEEVRAHPEKNGMGSTCVLMHLREGRVHFAHVGDSRIYRYRKGRLEQLTEDHSWVNESLRNGIITAEEAKNHRFKNVITRAVGTKETVLADTRTDFAAVDDIYLLCSDGLMAGKVTDEDIEKIVSSSADIESSAGELIRMANEGGGPDNITVILIKIQETSEAQEFIDCQATDRRRKIYRSALIGIAMALLVTIGAIVVWRAANYVPPAPPILAEIPKVTSSKSLILSGSGVPDSSVEIFIDGARAAKSVASRNGVWNTLVSLEREGGHEIKIRTLDGSGNAGPFGPSVQISLDVTPPAAPSIESPVEMQSFSTKTFLVNGRSESETQIQILSDGRDAGYGDVADNGEFSIEIEADSMAEGTHQILVTAVDKAGNASEGVTVVIELDRTPPPAPEFIFPLDGTMIQTTLVAVMAKARDADIVEFTLDGNPIEAEITRDEDIFSAGLANLTDEKAYVLAAVSRDKAGNRSTSKKMIKFGVSTKLPIAPVIISPKNGESVRAFIELSGTAVIGSTITISIDGKPTADIETSKDDGSWNWKSRELPEGSHTLSARSDSKGIKSPSSESVLVKIDRTPPPVPKIDGAAQEFIFTSSPDYALKVRTEPDLLVLARPLVIGGARVENRPNAKAGSGADGLAALENLDLAEGLNSFELIATDPAGNTSGTSKVSITLDTRPPPPPVLARIPAFVQHGTLELSGTGEPGSTILIEVSAKPTEAGNSVNAHTGQASSKKTTVRPDGSFGPIDATFSPGKNRLVFSASDQAGNNSREVSYIVSWYKEFPSRPFLELEPGARVAGQTLSVRGTANPGFEVSVSLNGRNAVTARVSAAGRFSATLDLREGLNDIEVVTIHPEDPAFKSSPAKVDVTFLKALPQSGSEQGGAGNETGKTDGSETSATGGPPQPGTGSRSLALKAPSPKKKVNINTASAAEISSALDIPLSLAEALVVHRRQNGNFNMPSKTLDVPGMLDYFDYVRGFIDTGDRQGGASQDQPARTRTLDSTREISIGDTVSDTIPANGPSGRSSAKYLKMKPPGRGIVKFLFRGRGLKARIMNDDPLSPSDMTEVKTSEDGLLAEWDTTMGWLPSFVVISVEPAGRSSGEIPFTLQTVFTSKGTGEGF